MSSSINSNNKRERSGCQVQDVSPNCDFFWKSHKQWGKASKRVSESEKQKGKIGEFAIAVDLDGLVAVLLCSLQVSPNVVQHHHPVSVKRVIELE
jgi:hypothetical protein